MFDLAWSEIMLIAAVAIVFIGPKELPAALRTFGKWTVKARTMAAEFQRNVDDMVREAELEDVKKQFDEVRGLATNPTGAIEKWVDPKGEIRGAFEAPELDKPALDKPALDKPAASEAPPVHAAAAPAIPASEPTPIAPAPEPAAASQPAVESAPPPAVTPPPAGAGTPAEPKVAVAAS